MAEPCSPATSPTVIFPRARSPTTISRIKIKNRRKRYLDTHPNYFSPSLELADPLAYDRLIRRFQAPLEREAEGRRKGYSGVLEADLWRSEAKIDALKNPSIASRMRYTRGQDGEIVAEEKDEVPMNKEEGLERWRKEMEAMFLRGEDSDFDYRLVDENEAYDDRGLEEREEEEKWFEEEEPTWIDQLESVESGHKPSPVGQTGIQDF